MPQVSPEKEEAEIRARAALVRDPVRYGGWIRIAGPLCAIALGVLAAWFYLRPLSLIRFIQMTRLGWSGVTQDQIALDDGLMSYLVTGGYPDQEPVIMIHGLGPNAALEWRNVIAPISEAHYKVMAPDLMGFGASEHKQVTYTIAYEAGAIGQFIDTLKLAHINLIGQDLGCDVALYYAVTHPEKVERLLLVSGGLIGRRDAERLRATMLPNSVEALRAQATMAFFTLPPMPDFMYQRMVASLARDLPAQTDMLNSLPRDEAFIRAHLGEIFNTLTVVIRSSNDPFISARASQALHLALPGSATVVFKGFGPLPQLNDPENFAHTAIYLLKQTEGNR